MTLSDYIALRLHNIHNVLKLRPIVPDYPNDRYEDMMEIARLYNNVHSSLRARAEG